MKKYNLIFTSVAIAAVLVISAVFTIYQKSEVVATSGIPSGRITVVLDAGHGGFDGGATGVDGRLEKEINLEIVMKIKPQLELLGIPCVLSRSGDTTTATGSFKTTREKKVSDMHNRLALVNATPNSILVSIHQNHYEEEKYSGLQVFYSGNNEESEMLASLIQNNTHDFLQQKNERQIKQATSDLYLLHKATAPSVMVECGFLSNTQENKLLQDAAYQNKLAYVIALSINQYINQVQQGFVNTTEVP